MLSHPIGFGFCGNCGGGPIGGGGGGGPPVGVGICFEIDAVVVPNQFRVGRVQVSVLLTEGKDSCHVISCGIDPNSGLVVSCESEAQLIVIAALAPAISLLRCCNSSVIGSEVLLLEGFSF